MVDKVWTTQRGSSVWLDGNLLYIQTPGAPAPTGYNIVELDAPAVEMCISSAGLYLVRVHFHAPGRFHANHVNVGRYSLVQEAQELAGAITQRTKHCLLYTSPSPRDS